MALKNMKMVSNTSVTLPDKDKNLCMYKNSYSTNSKSDWGVESILAGMGIEEDYIELFVNKEIDTDTFLILEEDDIVEIGVQDASVRARIMEGVRNCQLRKISQNKLRKQFSVVDGTRMLVSCSNQLDTLCNLLKYTRQRLSRKPAINQYLYTQYSASQAMQDISLALLARVQLLNIELQQLQQIMRQEGEKPKPVTRLQGLHEHSAFKSVTMMLVMFPALVMFTAWKMNGIAWKN